MRVSLTIIVFLGNVFSNVNALSGCVKNPIDIVFLLDGSGSVGKQRFGFVRDFVKNLVLHLNVGENATRVALMQFSGGKKTRFEFEINDYKDEESLSAAIGKINYQYGGLQETGAALRMVETRVFNGNQSTDRPWAKNVVVLLAEGPSTFPHKAMTEAKHLKTLGVRLVAIGIGNKITLKNFKEELESLASSSRDLFLTRDNELDKLIDDVVETLCPNVSVSSLVQTTAISTAPSFFSQSQERQLSTITVTSVLVKTLVITSCLSVPRSCPAPIMASSKTQMSPILTPIVQKPTKGQKSNKDKDRQSSKDFSGKRLKCFSCTYDETVAQEFSIDCKMEECQEEQTYCADAILQHNGKKFTKKSCASTQYCNSTVEQCVSAFKHAAEFSECRVNCCQEKLCNPYNLAAFIRPSLGVLSMAVFHVIKTIL